MSRGDNCEADHDGFAVGVDHLDIPFRVGDRVGPADDAVIGQQNRIVIFDKGKHGLGKGAGSWSFIGRQGDRPDKYFLLRDQVALRHHPGNGVGGGVGRMAVNDGFGAGDSFVNLQMQQNFAGLGTVAADLSIVEVDQRNVLHAQVSLAAERGRAENIVGRNTDGDIAAISIDILPFPELAAHAHHLLLEGGGLRRRENLLRLAGSGQGRGRGRQAVQNSAPNNACNMTGIERFHGFF